MFRARVDSISGTRVVRITEVSSPSGFRMGSMFLRASFSSSISLSTDLGLTKE